MARLARHVHLGPRRLVGVGRAIESLAQVRRVAHRALGVPVLAEFRPVQHVGMRHLLVRIQVIPALPALGLRAAVPGDAERLVPAVRKPDQVLLQRVDAEDVRHVEVADLAVGAVGPHDVLAVAPAESRRGTGVREGGVGEVAEHGGRCGLLHREVVMRPLPRLLLCLVAPRALRPADVRRWRTSGRDSGRATRKAAAVRWLGTRSSPRETASASAPMAPRVRSSIFRDHYSRAGRCGRVG